MVTLGSPVHAEEGPGEPVRIWYRSSDACPDGGVFVARLQELGRVAALAGVGDRIDFVVTLARSSVGSSGRLERQTERGTVAIRELRAVDCDEVAEGLALSLELTLTPAAAPKTEAEAAQAERAAVQVPLLPSVDAGPEAARSEPDKPGPREAWARLELGAHLAGTSGIAPGAALSGDVFVALGSLLRLRAFGAHGRGTGRAAETRTALSVSLLGGRIDSCPFGLRSQRFSLHPCLGFELGRLSAWSHAEKAHTDRGLWAAGVASARAGWRLLPALWTELELGARVPLVRYTLATSTGSELFRTPALGGELALGLRWAP